MGLAVSHPQLNFGVHFRPQSLSVPFPNPQNWPVSDRLASSEGAFNRPFASHPSRLGFTRHTDLSTFRVKLTTRVIFANFRYWSQLAQAENHLPKFRMPLVSIAAFEIILLVTDVGAVVMHSTSGCNVLPPHGGFDFFLWPILSLYLALWNTLRQ